MPLNEINYHLLHFLIVFIPMLGIQVIRHVNRLNNPKLVKIKMEVDPRYQKVNLID